MDPKDSFRIAAAAVLVDGKVAPEEKTALLALAKEIGLSSGDATSLLKEVAATGKAPLKVPDGKDDRVGLFRALVRIVASDGRVGTREQTFLKRVAPSFGIGVDKIDSWISAALDEVAER
jgi:uncharacterized tellurite resistance protein B-like protein